MTWKPKDEPMTSIVLTRPHTHAGTSYGIGERIEVDAATAEWLLANGIAVPEAKPVRTPTEPPGNSSLTQRKEPKQ